MRFRQALILTAFTSLYIFLSQAAFAARPLVVDDARPVAENNVQFSIGFTHTVPEKGGLDQQAPTMTLGFGVVKDLELGLTLDRINTDLKGESPARGFEDLHLYSKYNFVEEIEKGYVPAMTFIFDLKVPTANSHNGLSTGKFDEGFLLIVTKHWFPAAVDLNLGYTVVGRRQGEKLENQFFGGVALRYGLNENWRVVGDIYGLSREAKGERAAGNFQVGIRYRPNLPAYFDVAVGRSLLATGDRFQVTLGMTWSTALKF
ncbi:MAG TPA: hypothetical protein VL754_00815 [Verrucomicrobiae bacterium]|jgi:hypothetical protein|nr:hypothetical protein [Verrucomicrobiae bacterium]